MLYIVWVLGAGLGATTPSWVIGFFGALVGRLISKSSGAAIGAMVGMFITSWILNTGLTYSTFKSATLEYSSEQEVAWATLLYATLMISVACAIGYFLYRNIAPKENAKTPFECGKKCLAWVIFVFTLHLMPAFFLGTYIRSRIDSFSIWLINVVVCGAIAFAIGCTYGKLFKFKHEKTENGSEP